MTNTPPIVGAQELREKLSEYLDRAKNGESFVVVSRSIPMAILGPVPPKPIEDAEPLVLSVEG